MQPQAHDERMNLFRPFPKKQKCQRKMTIKDIQHQKGGDISPNLSDLVSALPLEVEERDVPVATVATTVATPPPINPAYRHDPTEDSIIIVPNARVVVREDKKTVLLPDFSQKIIEHRHMDDGTVDVYTRHVRVDGTTTCFEQLGVPESDLALRPDGPCFQGEHKAGTTYPTISAQLNGVSAGENDLETTAHQDEEQENMKRKRINKLVINITVFVVLIVLAMLFAEFLFFPAIILGIVVIANAVQLATGETDDDDCFCCS